MLKDNYRNIHNLPTDWKIYAVYRDNQITGELLQGVGTLGLRCPKHIPIQCWSEIDSYLPTGALCYGNSTFDSEGGTSYYQGEIRNSGGRVYLVTTIGGKL